MKLFQVLPLLLIVLLHFIHSETLEAQMDSDSIYVLSQGLGNRYIHGERIISFYQLSDIMKDNELATAAMQSAKNHKTLSMIVGGTGGFLLGWSLGAALGGGEVNWLLAGAGGGLILLSIPFEVRANKDARDAVDFYNSGLANRSSFNKPYLELGTGTNGLSLIWRF